jgi:GAF domain-containing protein
VTDLGPTDAMYGDALRALAGVLIDHPALEGTLEQLLAVAAMAVPEVTSMTVTAVAIDGSYASAASTDATARAVDEREYLLDEGPCIDALEHGTEQLIRDTHSDDRWPSFCEVAAAAGYRTVAGLPLVAPDGQVLGALDVFTEAPDGLDEDVLALLRRVTVPAGAVLANARAYQRTAGLGEQLRENLEAEGLRHRAVGVLLAQLAGDTARAVDVLLATADAHQLSVDEVAARLVAGEVVELHGV